MTAEQDAAMRMELVHAYVDGELDPVNALAISQQIADDPALGAEAKRIEALRAAVRDRLPREAAPAHLIAKIEKSIGETRIAAPPSWRALAASVLAGMVLASVSTWLALMPVAGDRMGEAVVDGHLRALMAPQPADVRSSERHTVKPWFNGRIPESPQVVDLASEGYPLIGGRIDVIDTRPVATLVYGRRLHLISVAAVPSTQAPEEPVARPPIKGTNLVHWNKNGVSYWAASDLNPAELETFARQFAKAL